MKRHLQSVVIGAFEPFAVPCHFNRVTDWISTNERFQSMADSITGRLGLNLEYQFFDGELHKCTVPHVVARVKTTFLQLTQFRVSRWSIFRKKALLFDFYCFAHL